METTTPEVKKKYILMITTTRNRTEKNKIFGEYTERYKCIEDAYTTILSLLDDAVLCYNLTTEEGRKYWNWCPNFNDIFIYNYNNKTLELKNPKYPLSKLYELVIYEFKNLTVKHKIIIKHDKQKKK